MRFPQRPHTPEESVEGRLAVLGSAAVANSSLALIAGAPITAMLCLALVGGGHYWSWRGRHRPRTRNGQFLFAVLVLGCVLYLLADLTVGALGGALPQAKFAVLVQAVTSFDLKTRRNLYTHLWHSLVVLYIAGVFAWTIAFLPLVLLWAACMWAFLVFTRERARVCKGTPGHRLTAWIASPRRQPRLLVRWGVAWLLLSALIFVALPRFAGRPIAMPFLVSMPLQSDLTGEVLPAILPLVEAGATGGEGHAINLRVRGRLGEEVVLRVRAPAESYWRAYTLERYDGQSWRAEGALSPLPPIALHIRIPDEDLTSPGASLPQTFYVRQPLGPHILAAYPLRELYFPARRLSLFDSGTVQAPFPLRRGTTYAAVSQVRDLSPAALQMAAPVDLEANRAALELPLSLPSRVRDLADRLAAGALTEYDQVNAIAGYLRSHYRYSLDTPRLPGGADAVDRFLFVDHVGFCEQFASALAVLLRAEGIPARVAVGYGTGEHNLLTGTFTVRARDAHAWVEVLFPGIGWVPVDASPGFDPQPASHRPARWFLSDLHAGVPFLSGGSLPGVPPPLAAAPPLLAVLALLGVAWKRRPDQLPAVRTYLRAQRWLRAGGLPVRESAETPAEHLARLSEASRPVAGALQPLAASVEKTVFGRPDRAPRIGVGRLAAAVVRHRLRMGR